MGAPIEFSARDTYIPINGYRAGGPFQLEAGCWTDDTTMALCLAETLLAHGAYEASDYGKRLVRWVEEGYNSLTGTCFDIGNTTRNAIETFRLYGPEQSGEMGPNSAGNGSIMRLAPVSVFYQENAVLAEEMAMAQGALTHRHAVPSDGCRLLNRVLLEGIKMGEKQAALASIDTMKVCAEFADVPLGTYRDKRREEIRSDGYVVSTLEAALWAVWNTQTFGEAILLGVNLGDDADTVGAVTGQIAGAIYGLSGIPENWQTGVADGARLLETAERLYAGRYRA